MTTRKIARALLSVSDKTGLVDFARALRRHGVDIVSTGGTAKLLREAGIEVIDVAEITGLPEMMDGRVKTLHPKIHGGLLALRENEAHLKALADHSIHPIDLLAANLYPFEQTVAGGADFATCIETIDIGGPAMIRAGAKNHDGVTVVVDPADYALVIAEMDAHGGATTLALRQSLAARAFARTAAYDAAIATWFADRLGETTPKTRTIVGRLAETLRYGENPHQCGRVLPLGRAALRRRHRRAGAGQGALLQQSQRHRRGLRAGRRVRSQGQRRRRHHQACQSVRRGNRSIARGSLRQGAGLRSRQRLRRHRRAEPHARRRRRAGDRQDLHRGDHRAGRERRGEGHSRREEESAPAARRRAAGPEGGRAQLSARSPAASSCSRATTALRARSRW